MNDRSKNKHDLLAKWIQEAGTTSPQEDFFLTVMSKLEEEKPIIAYEPIISSRQWLMIASVGVVIIVLSLFQSPVERTWTDLFVGLATLKIPSISYSFATPTLPTFVNSEIMRQAILVFFLLSVAVIVVKNKLWETR